MRVLATGATGQHANHVVSALTGGGIDVRAAVHDGRKADDAMRNGANETVVLDLADQDSVASAVEGVDGVFLITPAFHPEVAVMFRDYDEHGFDGGNSLVPQTILGRAPRSVADFIDALGPALDE